VATKLTGGESEKQQPLPIPYLSPNYRGTGSRGVKLLSTLGKMNTNTIGGPMLTPGDPVTP